MPLSPQGQGPREPQYEAGGGRGPRFGAHVPGVQDADVPQMLVAGQSLLAPFAEFPPRPSPPTGVLSAWFSTSLVRASCSSLAVLSPLPSVHSPHLSWLPLEPGWVLGRHRQ